VLTVRNPVCTLYAPTSSFGFNFGPSFSEEESEEEADKEKAESTKGKKKEKKHEINLGKPLLVFLYQIIYH